MIEHNVSVGEPKIVMVSVNPSDPSSEPYRVFRREDEGAKEIGFAEIQSGDVIFLRHPGSGELVSAPVRAKSEPEPDPFFGSNLRVYVEKLKLSDL